MPRTRKPIPPTQKELSKETQFPYDSNMGNPNLEPNPNKSVTGIPFNRSEEISLKSDIVKPFSIGLEDIDSAIFYYFNEVIKPYVDQNGERIFVPIIYSSPERWKSYQKDGYYRDKNGGIMLPIIAIRRDTVTKDRTVTNKLDSNHPNLYSSAQINYNARNVYSNFNILNNRIPTKQYSLTVVPSYVTLEYNCIVQTYFVEQLNKIIEAIEYASDSYWGDPERFKFRSFVDKFSTTVELIAEQKRSAKATFTIRLRGYIIPDTIQKDLTAAKKFNSKSRVTIGTQAVSNINKLPAATYPTYNPIQPPMIKPQWFGYTNAVLDYTYDNSNTYLTQFLSTQPDANVIIDTYDITKYVIFLSNKESAIIYDINNFVITKAFIKTQISQQVSDGSYITLHEYKTKEPATLGTYKLR